MMKKRVLLLAALLMITAAGCGKADSENTEQPATEETVQEEVTPPAPGEETWSTAPSYSATLITSTPIRYLSVTVGATESDVNMTWYSPSETPGEILLTTADDTDFANAQSFPASDPTASEITSGYYVNRAAVSGLSPETEYIYKVGNEEGYSPVYSYTTPTFSDTFRFTAIGDPQLGKPVDELDNQKTTFKKVLNKIKYHFPDSSFLLSLGDQVNDYNDTEQYDAFLNQAALYSLSLAPVKGNHDMGGPEYSEHFTLPNQSDIGTCDDEGDGDYWFVRGDALFMVLNVMDENKWSDHEEFIAAACEANPEVRWKLVFSHYSPYNSYEEYMEKGQEMRPYFLKFADDYDIDAVLCGHNHCYMRSYFINGDGTWQDYESPAVDPEGTMYLTLGSSSGSLYHRPSAQDEAAVNEKQESPQVTDVQVSPDSLTFTTYDAETWEIIDTYEIDKSVG